jgi:hypothetical protein
MIARKHRLRDSLPIRFGIGLIGLAILPFVYLWVKWSYFRYDAGEVGPIALCALAAIILGLGLIFVGIGQTIERRRQTGNSKERDPRLPTFPTSLHT